MGFLSNGIPPLDFLDGEFIWNSLLILNQMDWRMAQHWRSTGGRDCPDFLFGLLPLHYFQLITHN